MPTQNGHARSNQDEPGYPDPMLSWRAHGWCCRGRQSRKGRLTRRLPTPRYDLLERSFIVPRVLQATRGCPFKCSFCAVPDLNPSFRVRPIEDVVRNISETHFPYFWQEKVAWFWGDNLLVQRRWAMELLHELAGLDRWWLTQASIDIVKDRELLDLMERSGCIGIFLGIESLDEADLRSIRKRQNRAREYADAIERLHGRGICVMAGFISGFDDQTPQTILATADRLNAIGVDVPFLSILTPFRGTRLSDEQLSAGRILVDRDWPHYNGYNVAFRPAKMTPAESLAAHRAMWKAGLPPCRGDRASGPRRATAKPRRDDALGRNERVYGLKQITGNIPADAPATGSDRIVHPDPRDAPLRLNDQGAHRKGLRTPINLPSASDGTA
jgi:radical SAM superfamily enzyme YgiQ (UPF0313 family)